MKYLLYSIICFTALSSLAEIKHKRYKEQADKIIKLEQTQAYTSAALLASAIANQLATKAKFDETIDSIERTLTTKKKEIITEKNSKRFNFNFFFLLKGSYNQVEDVTEMITTNPLEVASFSSIKKRDFQQMQKNLQAYAKKFETEIYYSKMFAAKALDLASKVDANNFQNIYDLVMKTAQRVSQISFAGVETYTNCVHSNYVEKSEETSAWVRGLIGLSYKESSKQMAHSEKFCEDETIEHSQLADVFDSADLMSADRTLSYQIKKLGLKFVTTVEPEEFPTWGSPYYQ